MKSNTRGRFSGKQLWLIVTLLVVPALVMAGKLPGLPSANFFWTHFSLLDLPAPMKSKVDHILFVPLGALFVVFFRLTLGVRVLGPFRSILLAFAFAATGIVLGLIFLAVTIATLVTIRPLIKGMRLPYFGRISAMLSGVALLTVLGILLGSWLDFQALRKIAFFPLVVLCLIGDAFVRTASREGLRSTLWRTLMTALLAVILTFLVGMAFLKHLLLSFPEMLFVQTACLFFVAKYGAWRWLEWLNPKVGLDDDEDKDELDSWAAEAPPSMHRTRPVAVVSTPRETGDSPVSFHTENLE